MAATATQQIIHNGARNLVLKYTIAGTSGDASAVKLVDISALDANLGVYDLRLDKASWSLTGFSCKLAWDATTDVDLLELTNGWGKVDFTSVGGIPNNAGAGITGDVMFTTTGYEASGEGASFVLYFKKKNKGLLESEVVVGPNAGALAIASEVLTIVNTS
jgi:hypothetical protein